MYDLKQNINAYDKELEQLDQVLSKEVYEDIKIKTITQVRGTVQADILKEDQAQNTCIFSTEFALRLMGDVQDYFIENKLYTIN